MNAIEKTGRTVEEAIREALDDLGAERDAVDVEVLEEGSKGLFGLLGARSARVKVSLRPTEATVSAADVSDEKQSEPDSTAPEGTSVPAKTERSKADAIRDGQMFLEGILDRLGLDVGIETRESDENIVHMHITGEGVGLVIGRHGQTLDAIQYLTNIVANREGGERARIVIDAEGYRVRREEVLRKLAQRMAEKAVAQGRKAVLDPMSALERRIVHLTLQESNEVETYSEGEDPYRRVVIVPKEM